VLTIVIWLFSDIVIAHMEKIPPIASHLDILEFIVALDYIPY
jgi:hypothetical protein